MLNYTQRYVDQSKTHTFVSYKMTESIDLYFCKNTGEVTLMTETDTYEFIWYQDIVSLIGYVQKHFEHIIQPALDKEQLTSRLAVIEAVLLNTAKEKVLASTMDESFKQLVNAGECKIYLQPEAINQLIAANCVNTDNSTLQDHYKVIQYSIAGKEPLNILFSSVKISTELIIDDFGAFKRFVVEEGTIDGISYEQGSKYREVAELLISALNELFVADKIVFTEIEDIHQEYQSISQEMERQQIELEQELVLREDINTFKAINNFFPNEAENYYAG